MAMFAFLVNRRFYYLSPLFVSLVLGLMVTNVLGWPYQAKGASNFSTKKLLRTGVALLGLQISLHTFAKIGVKGFATLLVIVVATYVGVKWFARKSGLSSELSILIAGGFAICGASAIAAIGSARKSDTTEVSYAVGLVTLCGTLSIFVIPPLAHLLVLTHATSGAWIGAAVHDVGQVIATASLVGGDTMGHAIVSKLTRVVLLAPLLLILSADKEKKVGVTIKSRLVRAVKIPPFIAFFLLLVAAANFVHISSQNIGNFTNISKFLMSMGLFSMATSVKFSSLKSIGSKPLLFGLLAWVLCGGLDLILIRGVGI